MANGKLPGLTAPFIALLGLTFLFCQPIFARDAEPTDKGKPPAADPAAIRRLIAQLGDESFTTREAAGKKLAAIGEPALALLREAAEESDIAEVRRRAQQLVSQIERKVFGQVRTFEGHTGFQLRWAIRVAVAPDGKRAVSTGFDGLRFWDLATGKQTRFLDGNRGYWALHFSRGGRRLIAGGNDNIVRVFEVKTGKLLNQLNGHTAAVWGAVLLPGGKQAVTGAWDQTLRVWDVETGKELRRFKNAGGNVRCLALSPDGKTLAAGHFEREGGAGTVRLWDVEKSVQLRAFEGHTEEVSSVAFSPDGRLLVSSSFDHTVRLWNVATAKEVKTLKGHTGRVEQAVFTPEGKRVLSCGDEQDPTLRLWDVTSGKLIYVSRPVEGGLLGIAALPDGRQCLTAGKDGLVRLWRWAR
jgi:WD40 repeat protein